MKTDALTNPIVKPPSKHCRTMTRKPGRRSLSLTLNSMTMGALVASRNLPAMRSVTSGSFNRPRGEQRAGADRRIPLRSMGGFSDVLQVSALACR